MADTFPSHWEMQLDWRQRYDTATYTYIIIKYFKNKMEAEITNYFWIPKVFFCM